MPAAAPSLSQPRRRILVSVQHGLQAPSIPSPRAPSRSESAASGPVRQRKARTLLIGVAVIDVLLICVACIVAWELRVTVSGLWSVEPRPDVSFWSWPALTVVGLRLLVLHQRRIWRPRHLAADLDEFR